MTRTVARLSLVVSAFLIGVSAAVSQVTAVGATPLLLVVNDAASNPYGRYLGEILRAEGLNAYSVAQLSTLDSTALDAAELVVLAETPLSATEASLFIAYVGGGGRLIAMRPDSDLAPLFDLAPAGAILANPYLRIEGAQPAGQGLPGDTLQIHGAADRYTQNGGTTLATLFSTAATATAHPAVTLDSTGRAAAWTYDLARNVVLTRQGNPANADLDTDGDSVVRTIDLFQNSGGGAPWVNRDRIPIPQADVQQRLFARLVRQLLDGVLPLPQLWYFPGDEKTMLILTGDAHANPTSYFQNELSSINARNGAITLYLAIGGSPDNPSVQSWRAQGHEIGYHPPARSPAGETYFVCTSLATCYGELDEWWGFQGYSPKSRTVRNHQVAWQGWTDAADVAAANAIALDTNFYHWGPWIEKSDNSWPMGYITGSGQPMQFARADGSIVPVYQQLTQLVDEHLLGEVQGAGWQGLNAAQAIAVSEDLIDASLAGHYAAIMTQFHVDYFSGDVQVWAEGTMDYANAQGVPLWNADRWLAFTQARHDAELTSIAWNATTGQLSFRLSAPTSGDPLSVLLPLSFGGPALAGVLVDGAAASHVVFSVNGRQYALISVSSADHTVHAGYGAPPMVATPTSPPVPPSATPAPTGEPPATPTGTPRPTGAPTRPSRAWLPMVASSP